MLLADSPTEEKKPETRGRKSIITTEMIDACRELIELSGGKITLKSAVFSVSLHKENILSKLVFSFSVKLPLTIVFCASAFERAFSLPSLFLL